MISRPIYLLLLSLCLSFTAAFSQAIADTDNEDATLTEEDMMALYQAYLDSVAATFTYYRDTTVTIGDGLAQLTVPDGYVWLNPQDAQTVLVGLWGNPPDGPASLGMLFPEPGPSFIGNYGIDVTYTEEGHVKDDDAADIDYDELLKDMQASTIEENETRRLQGYPSIELLGWASPPYYDAGGKKLHWAKELRFDEQENESTLNYNILFLSRKGYLTMNVIGGMEALDSIRADLNPILASVEFSEGQRYADFDPKLDEIAAYGLGALVAGKVLAKTGLLAGIGIFLLKAWKLVLIALVGIGVGVKKLVGRGGSA